MKTRLPIYLLLFAGAISSGCTNVRVVKTSSFAEIAPIIHEASQKGKTSIVFTDRVNPTRSKRGKSPQRRDTRKIVVTSLSIDENQAKWINEKSGEQDSTQISNMLAIRVIQSDKDLTSSATGIFTGTALGLLSGYVIVNSFSGNTEKKEEMGVILLSGMFGALMGAASSNSKRTLDVRYVLYSKDPSL